MNPTMNIVLLWAGWTGLSSLGFLFKDLGIANVICVDPIKNQITDALDAIGYNVIIGLENYEIKSTDFVIYSDAFISTPELLKAKQMAEEASRKARYPMSYFQFLGEISKYFETIAIAGTHGKSTTTALATYTLSQLDSKLGLWILGALVPQLDNRNYWLNTNAKDDIKNIFNYILDGKQSEWDESLRKKYRFVIEADEFNRHFLYLDVDHALVLNAELDHSDIYANDSVYFEAFKQFGNKVKKNIRAIAGEKWIDRFAESLIHADGKLLIVDDSAEANVYHPGKELQAMTYDLGDNKKLELIETYPLSLQHIFGKHNQKNASLVYALTAHLLGYSEYSLWANESIVAALNSFTGLWRRMEYLKTNDNGALIYTDYGHHPTEINAVYHAMRDKYADKKLIAIVQPHQMRRVLEFWDEWVRVLKQFDELYIYPIYAAREDIAVLIKEFEHKIATQAANPEDIGLELGIQTWAKYLKDIEDVKDIMNNACENDIVTVFTAGNLDYLIRN